MRVLDFVSDPERLLQRADRVITMGGYNSVCEVLSAEKRALIVPRVAPRTEQLIRAERLQQLGLVDMLHPSMLSPDSLGEWLVTDRPGCQVPIRQRMDFNGLDRLPRMITEMMSAPRSAMPELVLAS
jgi:predicted glycosyltransferase